MAQHSASISNGLNDLHTDVIATLEATPTGNTRTRVFYNESSPGRSRLLQYPSGRMLFQHFCNFADRGDFVNHLNAIGHSKPGPPLEYYGTTRLLTLRSLVAFIRDHPSFKYILYATVTADVTIPPNTGQISLLPARPDGRTRLMVHWLCDLDDGVMNAEISNSLDLSLEVIEPEALLPSSIRPFNVYTVFYE
ncbi:predicted protein [Sclerotinia sclerotiorum 1980 UF-70]|uniref:Uncharacterized protein n=1 Tax=Sclerotinia sclerotiorum (strain ATCC 18683 / 1980 / Ss-1) TaxID=665079 RepID=A7F7Y1_SCLS1|nr:predicted protein [Sclerotinia sclerotiorum 1980 UF-70]EDN98852.1 predicted protein [Sclerotinia sclerotiorum 1980 UF-70]